MNINVTCLLCGVDVENHSHLFCDCSYSRMVLNACPVTLCTDWNDMCSGNFFIHGLDVVRTNIVYLFIAAAFYHIWTERNFRMHNPGKYNSSTLLTRRVFEDVRNRLSSCNLFSQAVRQDRSLLSFIY